MTDRTPTILIDPMDDVADQLAQVEGWLRFADTNDENVAETIGSGARAAGDLAGAIRRASRDRVALWSPERTELAPALLIYSGPLTALKAAVDKLIHRAARSRHAQVHLDAVYLLSRCAEQDRMPDHHTLAPVLALANPAGADVRLTADQHVAYQRYCRAVLKDPLDQLAAGI